MKNSHTTQDTVSEQFGMQIARYLTSANADLPHGVVERLRATRERALDAAQRSAQLHLTHQWQKAHGYVVQPDSSVAWGGGGAPTERFGFVGAAFAWLALLALVLGMLAISHIHSESRASEDAELDTAILTDSLPPEAYTDSGFVHFLKTQIAQEAAAQDASEEEDAPEYEEGEDA